MTSESPREPCEAPVAVFSTSSAEFYAPRAALYVLNGVHWRPHKALHDSSRTLPPLGLTRPLSKFSVSSVAVLVVMAAVVEVIVEVVVVVFGCCWIVWGFLLLFFEGGGGGA